MFNLIASVIIATNGVTAAYIFPTQRAGRCEQKAAMELRTWMSKSGLGGPMVINTPRWGTLGGMTAIHPVSLENARHLVPKRIQERLDATKNREAFVIATDESKVFGKRLFIVGKTDIGVYYGANAFLEDYAGIRFFHAGPGGTCVPKGRRDLILENVFDFREPAMDYRHLNCWYGCVKPLDMWKDVCPWMARRSYTFREYGGHEELDDEKLTLQAIGNQPNSGDGELTIGEAVPMSLYNEHPEYFPLVGGRRDDGENASKWMRRCLSNREVKQLVTVYAIRHLSVSDVYSFDYRDHGGGWCECEKCREYGTGSDGKFSVPNMCHRFGAEVAAAVFKVRPDATFRNLTYLEWREPLTIDFHPDPRMQTLFCPHQRCYVHRLADPDCKHNRRFLSMYDFWRSKYSRLGFFEYYCYSTLHYCPVEYVMAEDFRNFFDRSFDGWLEDASAGTGEDIPYIVCNWQLYYLASKMFWNPKLDYMKLLEESYDLYYGVAAKPMKEYHAFRKLLWENCPGHAGMGVGDHQEGRYRFALGIKGAEEKLRGYLAEAERLAQGDDDILKRIRLDCDCLEKFWVKKWNKTKACYRMRESLEEKLIDFPENGDFRFLDKDGYPKKFGSDKKKFENGAVVLSNAVFYAFTDNPGISKPTKVKLSVEAAGRGELRLALKYCIREPGNREQVKMETDVPYGTHKLTAAPQVFSETHELPAHARIHIFFFGGPDVRLRFVRCEYVD